VTAEEVVVIFGPLRTTMTCATRRASSTWSRSSSSSRRRWLVRGRIRTYASQNAGCGVIEEV